MAEKTVRKIVLAAGGTGGHLFPAEALTEELLTRGHQVTIMTDKRGQAFKSLGDRVTVHTVRAATLKPGLTSKIRAVVDMNLGILTALLLLIKDRPDVVVGFGGYPSFPGVFAGQLLGIPTILHEQNAVLGKANQFLAFLARKIALSLPNTKSIRDADRKKTVLTGNPVRKNIIEAGKRDYAVPVDIFNILITGGSQAANIFGEIVPVATALLPQDLRVKLRIMHQCREEQLAAVTEKYRAAGVTAEVKTFFSDMAERLGSCHLFIGRSGASTVAEIAVAGLPAIFVPLRHADMQQKYNAEVLSNAGAAWLILQENFTPEALAQKMTEVMQNPFILEKSALAAKTCARPAAAQLLADAVVNGF